MSRLVTTSDFYAKRYDAFDRAIASMYIGNKKIYDFVQLTSKPNDCICGGYVDVYEVLIDELSYFFPAEYCLEVDDYFTVDDRSIYDAIQDRLQDPTTNYKKAYLEKLGIDIEADLMKNTPLYREEPNPGAHTS